MRSRGKTAGFTLLEVAVAMAILSLAVVSCLQIFSGSLRLQDRASRSSRAVLLARAHMDALIGQPDLRDHVEERQWAGGFTSRVTVRHAGAEEGLSEGEFEVESDTSLRYLQVDVMWNDGRGEKSYTLKSMRTAPETDE